MLAFQEGTAGLRVGGRRPLRHLAVERREWGRWQVGTSEQDRPAGKGRVWASLKRPFTEPAGFHGNPVFL